MSKFNVKLTRSASGRGPIVAEQSPSGVTHEGGAGYVRDLRSELFLLAVSNMVGEATFYESAGDRDSRYVGLVRRAAVADPVWTAEFLRWLRSDANMRSASLVGAAEYVKGRIDAGVPLPNRDHAGEGASPIATNRRVVDSVLQRADEPGEILAYWTSRYGRRMPMPLKNGVADAAKRLYTERNLLKYDTASHGWRFADVIDMVHPRPVDERQSALFQHALERRHGREVEPAGSLAMVHRNRRIRQDVAESGPDVLLDAEALKAAGMTWEDALSLAGQGVDKAALWSALIPSMGYMALLRNLRGFDEAGVPDEVAERVAARLADPEQVARSRQFPFRFLSAYEAAPSLRWGHALDRALQLSLASLPALPGRTLVLVDTSGSMTGMGLSGRSKVSPLKAAAVFGVALAAKGERVDLVGFADGRRPFTHRVAAGASVVREVTRFVGRSGEDGHGTAIAASLRASFKGQDRVVIVSDMQTMDRGVTSAVPASTPMYGFNLGGYRMAAMPSAPGRVELGGLTDATFRMIPLLESGRDGDWPWVTAA